MATTGITSGSSYSNLISGIKIGPIIPNPVGIKALKYTPQMEGTLLATAEVVKDFCITHWHNEGPHPYETGAYASSFEASADIGSDGAVGYVANLDEKAWWMEYGTEHNRAFVPLVGGAEDAGLHVGPAVRGMPV